MSGASNPVRSRNASFVTFLMLTWLLGLSVAAIMGYHLVSEQASQEQVETGQRQLHSLEARMTALVDAVETIQAQPEFATVAALQSIRHALDARVTHVEQTLTERVGVEQLDALRIEIAQLKARPATVQPAAPVQARPKAKPAVATHPRKEPFPFQVLGIELRAGQRALSIAPTAGKLTADQIQVLLPGETLGLWVLESLEANTAVFSTGKQTRRLAIP
uniref:hypothetical protein n=1 Tax=Marinobacterium profundum TaxID=1714300 RepID=UPI00082DF152|nr:hypothetical protein [Marinobacterium profundum]